MDKLEFKLEQIYGARPRYIENTKDLIESVKNRYFQSLYEIEDLNSKNDLKLKIESVPKITKNDINVYFNSLFEAPNNAYYLLSIKKIKEFLEKQKIKLKVKTDEVEENTTIDYKQIETKIKNKIKDMINSFGFPINFDYCLKEQILIETKENKKEKNEVVNSIEMYGIEYLGTDYVPKLLDVVIQKLPVLKLIIDSYSLLSVQQVDFSCHVYSTIKECFVKVKNSRLQKVDISAIYGMLLTSDKNDYEDIFSENYITFVATLLECAYFLCDYCLSLESENEKPKNALHKDENTLKNYISDNIDIFFDRLSYIESYDAIEKYVEVHNYVTEFNAIDLVNLLKS